jgi:hypothetical protein
MNRHARQRARQQCRRHRTAADIANAHDENCVHRIDSPVMFTLAFIW